LLKKNTSLDKYDYVFTSATGKKLRERKLLASCKLIGIKAGIKKNCYLHKFRHSFATHLVRKRVPIERIQKLLGHSSITETQIYAHLSSNSMHEDVSVLNGLS
jgi:integrase/recombinase XerD